ncbi:MAG: FadR family transcriptional regulator [Proteobacteria bacterium]|nr:MAG: FadR family transcriptional regulator [Pseudomonadota bacterium]QKK12340.1 MAG: FadR family transcriptional regulator [Pseudomonadota bacterium]
MKDSPVNAERKTPREARSKPKFRGVSTRRLFEEVCDQIRVEVAAGNLRPGDKLPPERELAEHFEVSRVVIREALRSLEVSGIVALRKGVKGGAFIQDGYPDQLSQSIRDLFHLGRLSLGSLTEARVLVMQMVVPLACKRATEEDLATLERNVEETATLAEDPLQSGRLAHNLQFYQLVAACTHNNTLRVIVDLVTEVVLHELMHIDPDPLADLARSRRRFFRLFRARDVERATKQMVTHLKKLHRHLSA